MSSSNSAPPTSVGSRAANRTPAGGNRLPATRERRPAMAALAVILILLGAAGSALIALRSGERSDFVAVGSKDLPPGHKIEAKDLGRASVAGNTDALIPWSQASNVIGHYTTTRLYKNQFFSRGMVTTGTTPDVPSGGALVGVTLEPGQWPEGLDSGDIVSLVQVPASASDGSSPTVLVRAAEVTDAPDTSDSKTGVGTPATTTSSATVLVPTDKSTAVAAAAAAKRLVLVKLAPGTKPEVTRAGGS